MRYLYRLIILLLILAGPALSLNGCSKNDHQPVTLTGSTMGTTYHIKLLPDGSPNLDPAEVTQLIDARLAQIDASMSTYKQESEISRFNRHPRDSWMEVSAETLLVIEAGQKISDMSDGAFDMTVGPLVDLWGFGPTISDQQLPPAAEIEQLLPELGYRKLHLRSTPPALLKKSAKLAIDLSALAKGHAVDAVALLLKQQGYVNFLVEIGGELVTRGEKAPGTPWVIGVERPEAEQRSVQRLVPLHNAAMATSGDYRNYFEHDGKRYSHTIDPSSGYPISHNLASVTVIEDSCMRADALATAIMVMGPEKGLDFAERNDLAVLMLVKQGDDFVEQFSSAFSCYRSVLQPGQKDH